MAGVYRSGMFMFVEIHFGKNSETGFKCSTSKQQQQQCLIGVMKKNQMTSDKMMDQHGELCSPIVEALGRPNMGINEMTAGKWVLRTGFSFSGRGANPQQLAITPA